MRAEPTTIRYGKHGFLSTFMANKLMGFDLCTTRHSLLVRKMCFYIFLLCWKGLQLTAELTRCTDDVYKPAIAEYR